MNSMGQTYERKEESRIVHCFLRFGEGLFYVELDNSLMYTLWWVVRQLKLKSWTLIFKVGINNAQQNVENACNYMLQ